MSVMAEVPKSGTKVRRKRDGKLYTVGAVYADYLRLNPVWDGRTHAKDICHFLKQYELE